MCVWDGITEYNHVWDGITEYNQGYTFIILSVTVFMILLFGKSSATAGGFTLGGMW